MNTNTTNKVVLTGTVIGQPTYSHTVFGENFHIVELSVPRLSGNNDTLPISLSEHLLSSLVTDGNKITVVGQLRSYNKLVETHSKLLLTVFVQDVLPCDESINPNTMELDGYICKAPVYRTTPFNREICDVLWPSTAPTTKVTTSLVSFGDAPRVLPALWRWDNTSTSLVVCNPVNTKKSRMMARWILVPPTRFPSPN